MRVAICDDEEQYRKQVIDLLTEYENNSKNVSFSFSTFSNPDDLLVAIEKVDEFDIYILDIIMSGINGIELGLKLREKGYNGIIIYLTSSAAFAIDSYRVEASNYILKPIIKNVLFNAMDKILSNMSKSKSQNIIVKNRHSSILIPFEDILYVDLCKRALSYHLQNGDIVESTMLRVPFGEAVAPLLQDDRFYHCSKTLVINLNNVTQVSMDNVVFKNNITAYFSKNACRDIRSEWSEYWSTN